jgi:hypothetical protein
MGWASWLGARLHETTVDRDDRGRARSKTSGERTLDEIRAYARRCRDMEDRLGPPVRFSPDVAGWWYMIKGPQRWIRQQARAGWHHGYYYRPGRWMPVTPPRDEWPSRTAYQSPPGTGHSHLVPAPVVAASNLRRSDLTGHRPAWDGSPRREAKQTGRTGARTGLAEQPTRRGLTTARTRAGRVTGTTVDRDRKPTTRKPRRKR